jgi:small GTP-binding protein
MTDNQQQGQQQNKDDVSGNSHGACTKSRGHISTSQNRIVRAVDVFVSVPSVGDEFSGHPRSAEYAKRLSLLSAEDMRSHEYLFKILLVGDMCSRIGKSSYLLRAAENIFLPDSYPTIGVDFKIINRGFSHPICEPSTEAPLRIKMQLWDTAGPERFRTITRAYYRGAHGHLVFFDLTSRISFENVPLWMAEIAKYGNSPNAVVLVGMKSDRPWEEAHVTETRHPAADRDIEAGAGAKQGVKQMEGEKEGHLPTEPAVSNAPWTLGYRSVTSEEAAAMAAQYNIPYIECSALSGENVQDVLATMVHEIFVSKEELRKEIPISRAPAPGQRPSRSVCAMS